MTDLHFVVLEDEAEEAMYVRLDEIVAVIARAGGGSWIHLRRDPQPVTCFNDPAVVIGRMAEPASWSLNDDA